MSEIFSLCATGLSSLLHPDVILWIVVGTILGIIVGAIPGFTSTMACGILLPVTFFLDPYPAMCFLVAVYIAAIYGGSITAIILNAPGTPESTATTFDGYQLTQKGMASEALGTAIGSSFFGGLISYFVMLFCMLPVAKFALKFGPSEMFLLALFGIVILVAIGSGKMLKTAMAGSLGLLIGTIGITPLGEWRATFGTVYLAEGVQMVPAIIGLFALGEMFDMVGRKYVVDGEKPEARNFGRMSKALFNCFRYPFTTIRSAIIGTVIGAIPAAGGTLAAFTSYAEAKRASKHPEAFGTGDIEGVVAPETANNACTGGALITTLAIGVPGSSTCALLMGALMMQGLTPGPQLVTTQLDLVYGLIIACIMSQFLMVAMSMGMAYGSVGLLKVNTYVLVPVISVMCVIGTYAIRKAIFDVALMLIFGVIGWFMKKYDYPPVALVLGIVLGPIADNQLIRVFARFESEWFLSFFNRPITFVLSVVMILLLVSQIYREIKSAHNRMQTK